MTLKELAVRFGCAQVVTSAKKILETFSQHLPAAQKQFLDCTLPVYSAAALTLAVKQSATGKKGRLGVPVTQIYKTCQCKSKEFKKTLDMLQTAVQKASAVSAEGSQRNLEDNGDIKRHNDDDSSPRQPKKPRRESFEAWRERILSETAVELF